MLASDCCLTLLYARIGRLLSIWNATNSLFPAEIAFQTKRFHSTLCTLAVFEQHQVAERRSTTAGEHKKIFRCSLQKVSIKRARAQEEKSKKKKRQDLILQSHTRVSCFTCSAQTLYTQVGSSSSSCMSWPCQAMSNCSPAPLRAAFVGIQLLSPATLPAPARLRQ